MNYKMIFSVILVFTPFILLTAQEETRPKVAVVLSGGGAKGFAHIGALKILEEHNIPIDIIVGTSMGSIVGGLYSIGYSAEEIENMAKSQDWESLLSDDIDRTQLSPNKREIQQRYLFSLPTDDKLKPNMPQGAIHGQNLANLFSDLCSNVPKDADFNEFPIKFACIGTDLVTGKEVVLNKGFLPTAIYSSMAIPGVFMPSKHEGYTLIDGGLVNNFPTDVAKSMGADIIIGVDIRTGLHDIDKIVSIEQVIDQLIGFYSIDKDSINTSNCSVLIQPDITGYNTASFYSSAVDSLIHRGEKATIMLSEKLELLKTSYNLIPRKIDHSYVNDGQWEISNIKLTGNYNIKNQVILDYLKLKTPGNYSYSDIKKAIDRIYGLGFFEKVYFNFINEDDGSKQLEINLFEQPSSNINIGLRANTTDAVSVLLNYTHQDYRRILGNYSISANICSNPEFNFYGELNTQKLPTLRIELDAKYQDYRLYWKGRKNSIAEMLYTKADVSLFKNISNNMELGAGINLEFYYGEFYTINSDSLLIFPQGNTFISNSYIFYSIDNLNNYYFPTKGCELHTNLSIFENEELNNLYYVSYLKFRHVFMFGKNVGILTNAYGRTIFSSSFPLVKQNFIGGHGYDIYFENHLPFYGIPPILPAQQYAYVGLVGVRTNFHKNHYLSLLGNIISQSDDVGFHKNVSNETGYAISYTYNSGIGPIELTAEYSDWYKKIFVTANIGFWF
jgi:NTE family protein